MMISSPVNLMQVTFLEQDFRAQSDEVTGFDPTYEGASPGEPDAPKPPPRASLILKDNNGSKKGAGKSKNSKKSKKSAQKAPAEYNQMFGDTLAGTALYEYGTANDFSHSDDPPSNDGYLGIGARSVFFSNRASVSCAADKASIPAVVVSTSVLRSLQCTSKDRSTSMRIRLANQSSRRGGKRSVGGAPHYRYAASPASVR